jgi:hypothetical protein
LIARDRRVFDVIEAEIKDQSKYRTKNHEDRTGQENCREGEVSRKDKGEGEDGQAASAEAEGGA